VSLTSTWSAVHLSILSDLTFEMCVPSLRWIDAHRIHKKMPRFQLAHDGFLALQSAHCEFPGCRNRSCSSRSLRACSRLLMAAMVEKAVPALVMMVCATKKHTRKVKAIKTWSCHGNSRDMFMPVQRSDLKQNDARGGCRRV